MASDELKKGAEEIAKKAQDAVNKAKEIINSDDLKKRASEFGDKAQEGFNKAKDFLTSEDLGKKSKETFETIKGQMMNGDPKTKIKFAAIFGGIIAVALIIFLFVGVGDNKDIKLIKNSPNYTFQGRTIGETFSQYKFFSGGTWGELSKEKQQHFVRSARAANVLFSTFNFDMKLLGFAEFSAKYTGLSSDIIPNSFREKVDAALWEKIAKRNKSLVNDLEFKVQFGIVETQKIAQSLSLGISALEEIGKAQMPKTKFLGIPIGCSFDYKGKTYRLEIEDAMKAIGQNQPIDLYSVLPSEDPFCALITLISNEEIVKALKGKQFASVKHTITNGLDYSSFVDAMDTRYGEVHCPLVLSTIENLSYDAAKREAAVTLKNDVKAITAADLNVEPMQLGKTLVDPVFAKSLEKHDTLQSYTVTLRQRIHNTAPAMFVFQSPDSDPNKARFVVNYGKFESVLLTFKANEKVISFAQERLKQIRGTKPESF